MSSPKKKSRPHRRPKLASLKQKSFYQENEIKLHGFNAIQAVFKNRARDLVKIYVNQQTLPRVKELLMWCAKNKKAYDVVSSEDLEKIASSVHHEGICAIVKNKPAPSLSQALQKISRHDETVLYLDGVENPHNIGNILRTAAHFGIRFVLSSHHSTNSLPPATWRIAEGGMEYLDVIRIENPTNLFLELKKSRYHVYGTSSHHSKSIHSVSFKKRSVIVLGQESFGMSEAVLKLCDERIKIDGTDHVESLNVSSAAAILMSVCIHQKNKV